MSSRRLIVNDGTGQVVLARARVCASFVSRLAGLCFRGPSAINEGALFVCGSSGRIGAAVHTLFIRSAIGVIWLDPELTVVDKKLAQPSRFAHVPAAPALYYLEAEPSILGRADIGDQLRIEEAVS